MDVWSVGGDTEHLVRDDAPTMKDIVNHLRNTNVEANITDAAEVDDIEDADNTSRLPTSSPTVVYRKRWYILLVFAIFTAIQGEVSNTWSPIEDSAQFIFGWSDHTVALICNLVLIAYVVAIPLSTWILDLNGLRISCLLAALLMTLGTGIRCITSSTPLDTWLVCTGQVLIGFSGPVAVAGAPLLSATWFPANQRTTSTAIALITNNIGLSLSFIAGPLVVPNVSQNSTLPRVYKYHQVKTDIMKYMYISFASCAFVFLLVLVYFPAQPPVPPTVSAGVQRVNYKDGLRILIRNRNFWILALAYSIPNGVAVGWVSVIDLILSDIGVSQQTAGWIGFIGAMVSSMGALILGYLTDKFRGRIKQFLITLYSVGALAFIVFLFIYYKMIQSVVLLCISLSVAALGVLANGPLFYSMASEVTFPVGEAVTNGAFTILFKLFSIIFLFVLSVSGGNTSWMNWCFIASIVVSLPVLLLFKEQYDRLNMDTSASQAFY